MPAAKATVNLALRSYLGVRIGFILNTIVSMARSIDKKAAESFEVTLFIKL